MKTKAIFFVCIALMLTFTVNLTANEKTYPGSTCVFEYDNESENRDGLWFRNNGSSSKNVICPIVRDHVTNGLDDATIWIDGTSASNVRFEYRRRGGGTTGGWAASCSVYQGSSTQTCDWDGLSYYDRAALAITLTLGSWEKIWQYEVDEN